MKILAVPISLSIFSFSLFWIPASGPRSDPASTPQQTTIRISSNLTLVGVTAENAKSGTLDRTLSKSDFQIFDDGRRVPIRTFDAGVTARPLAVWFLGRCNQKEGKTDASGLSAVSASLVKTSLARQYPEDSIGVAHWCDNGGSSLDLLPTRDADNARLALEPFLISLAVRSPQRAVGDAFWATLHSVIDNTLDFTPERVPLVILLNAEGTISAWETDYIGERLVETSTTVYALKTTRSSQAREVKWASGQDVLIADHLAQETGGQVVSVAPSDLAVGLKRILDCAHSRYELGFIPEVLDGKRHTVRVALSRTAQTQHRGVSLRYRSEYLAIRGDDR